jgi:hypothetical protein
LYPPLGNQEMEGNCSASSTENINLFATDWELRGSSVRWQ